MSAIFKDNTDKVISAIKEATERGLEMIGLQAEKYAKMNAPVDTGNLKNSITHAPQGEDTMVIGTNVEYAAYV